MTGKQLLQGWLILAAILAVLAVVTLTSGCGMTPRQHFYAGQSYDMATTWYALEDDRFVEENPLADDAEDVLLLKAVVCGAVELCAWLWPDDADTFYKIGAVAGYAAGAWNTGLMIERGRK